MDDDFAFPIRVATEDGATVKVVATMRLGVLEIENREPCPVHITFLLAGEPILFVMLVQHVGCSIALYELLPDLVATVRYLPDRDHVEDEFERGMADLESFLRDA